MERRIRQRTPFANRRQPAGDAVLVIFNDYHNSPHCRLADLNYQKAFKNDPNLKLVIKQFPVLGPDSQFPAFAALASRKQGKSANSTAPL